MLYSMCKENSVILDEIGGNGPVRIKELVEEIRRSRRGRFLSRLFSMESGEANTSYCFDGITFFAVLEDHYEYGSLVGKNYEGKITYELTAGGDWTWKLETEITWASVLPIVGGSFHYVTRIISKSDEVKDYNINAMTGTSLEIKVIENNLHLVSAAELLKRDNLPVCEF